MMARFIIGGLAVDVDVCGGTDAAAAAAFVGE
jgi:hypothetical protein